MTCEKTPIEQLEAKIGYRFQNQKFLERALTTIGYTNEHPKTKNQEIYCTLGDAILKSILVDRMVGEEGKYNTSEKISDKKKEIEPRKILSDIAGKTFLVGQYLIMSEGEIKQKANENKNVLAESLEAIIGAIFLDSSYEQCKKVVLGWKEIKAIFEK